MSNPVVTHQSFRPSDFAWRDLPFRLARIAAAPFIFALRATKFWPESSIDGQRGNVWRARLWRAVLVVWRLLPLSFVIVCGVATYSFGRGWISHSTAMTLSRPAMLMISDTPFESRFLWLQSNILSEGLKDGGNKISDLR